MFRKTQGEPLKLDHAFVFCLASFLMTIATGGIPHAGSWQKPTRLPCPWDSSGKNTGVGCHFLLQCMKVKSESEVAQSSPTLSDLMDCSLPGSSIHGIFLEATKSTHKYLLNNQ